MRTFTLVLSLLSLLGLVAAALAYVGGWLSSASTNHLLLVGSVLWLVTAPVWMRPRPS